MTNDQSTRFLLPILALFLLVVGIGGAVMFMGSPPHVVEPDSPPEKTQVERVERTQRGPSGRLPSRPRQADTARTSFPYAPRTEGFQSAPPAGSARGVVRAADGLQPVAECRVEAYHVTGERVGRTLTNEAGEYRVPHLPIAQPLVLRFSAPGFLTGLCCDLQVEEGITAEKSVELVRGPAIGVRVRLQHGEDAAGETRPHAGVEAFLVRGDEPVASATTDDEGLAILRAPGHGAFGLRLRGEDIAPTPDEEVSILAGRDRQTLDRTVRVGGTLQVTVLRPDGTREKGATVVVSAEGLDPVTEFSDGDGEAEIAHLPPSLALQVSVVATGGYGAGETVYVVDREETHLTLDLAPPGSVSGWVVPRGSLDVAGVELTIGELTAVTDERGRFAVPLVPAGEHAITIVPAHLRPYRNLDPLEVAGGRESALSIEVEAAPVVDLSGSVVDLSGRGVLGAVVLTRPGDVKAVTDRRGSFLLEGLVEGEDIHVRLQAAGHVVVSTGRGVDAPLTPRALTAPLEIVVAHSDLGPSPDAVRALPIGAPAAPTRGGFRADVVGRLVTPSGSSAAGMDVRCRRQSTRTRTDGSFSFRHVAFVADAAPPTVIVVPGAGLLLPAEIEVTSPRPAESRTDLGTIRLEIRPHAVIDVRGSRDAFGAPLRRFWYASAQPDEFLGSRRAPLEAVPCLSYDGTWIHLPPADASSRCVTLFAVDTGHGIVTTHDSWIVRADARAVLHPMTARSPTHLDVLVPKSYRNGWLRLRQLSHGADESFTKALGEVVRGDLAEKDPFRALISGARFAEPIGKQRAMRIADLAPGTWKVELFPSPKKKKKQGEVLEKEVDLAKTSRLIFD